MKRISSLTLVIILVLSLAVGCSIKDNKKFVVGMITDTGSLGDQSFNDSAWYGLEKAKKDLKIEPKALESQLADDYVPNLTRFAEEKVDLIIGVGYLFKESMKAVATQYPEQKFAVLDTIVDAPNVASLMFAGNEGSYLVGIAAGLATKTNKVGFIGGMQSTLIREFEYGFRAGVKAVNPNAEVFVQYADSFNDSARGKEIALAQNSKGADVIYHAAGGVGVGLIEAAEEKGFWAIGVDKDQSELAPKNVLCSMIKRVDVATYEISKDVIEGKFQGGLKKYGISDEAIGYSDNAGNLPEDIKTAMEKHKQAIIDGKIVVPKVEEEFQAFKSPELR
ncbi:BMP family ABC transporter substrate-binding protein [Proteiniborus sp.]|uniref:BMP family lipoprotein n=1 Tax=Proteiniborus sp. TaxID=2079015 RepID=UPI003322AB6E